MRRRILHVIPSLEPGGPARQLTVLIAGLVCKGYEVKICVLTGSGRQPTLAGLDGAATVVTNSRRAGPVTFLRLRKFVREFRPDLVHTWQFLANTYGRAAALSAGIKKIVSSELHGGGQRLPVELVVDRFLARRSNRIVVTDEATQQMFVRRGVPAEKLAVVPCAAVDSCGQASSTARARFRRELGLPGDVRLIGAAGCLVPANRFKDLIWTADLLKIVYPNVHLLIMGDGPQRWRLERFRQQVQIADRVHFLDSHSELSARMPHLDCVWSGSGSAEQSEVILQAMAAGIPVIAADVPNIQEMVVPDETGFLFPVGNRGALARRSKQILDDPALARRLGEAARKRMMDRFSVQTMVQRYMAIYRNVLDDP